ncbi:MAG: ribonuclease R, partial [Chitinophagaceae bacterium]
MPKKTKKNKKGIPARHARQTFRGTIEVTRSGMGYVTVAAMKRDMMIRPQDLNMALHGDTVEVELLKQTGTGRTEGRVVRIIERKQIEFIGHLQQHRNQLYFIPSVDRPMPDIRIEPTKVLDAQSGDKVIVRL